MRQTRARTTSLAARIFVFLVASCVTTAAALGQTALRVPAPHFTLSASGPGEVTVTIARAAGAVNYYVYRSVDTVVDPVNGGVAPGLEPVGTVPAFSTATKTFVDRNLPTLVWQHYTVVAENALGDVSNANSQEIVVAAAPDAEIWGFADTHTHQFANLGFGGLLFHGSPFSSDGNIQTALPWCDFRHDVEAVRPDGSRLEPDLFGNIPVHGAGGLYDLVGVTLGQGVGHLVGGYPQFDGWPKWSTKDHQQMYYEWLYRAYRGGLKLMVMHAVNNKILCRASNQVAGFGCDDMAAADRQIQAAKDLEAFIDSRAGGPGQGWYRIAYSATQARQIINSGKMAVILGIEVDDLLNCNDGQCTPAELHRRVQHYYDLGVRQVHPVHLFNNAYGGAAEYEDVFNYGNRVLNGQYFQSRECSQPGTPDDIRYRFGGSDDLTRLLVGLLAGPAYTPPPHAGLGECNSVGLTPLGESLMGELMDHGMIIDIDHMSQLGLDRALELAEARHYPAISMGHTGFLETHAGAHKIEADKTATQIERMRKLGGIIGVITHKGATDQLVEFPAAGQPTNFVNSHVANDCDSSSKTFAQEYLYVVDRLRGGAVGLGSDFNGLNGQPAPRFGPERCKADDGAPVHDLTGGNQAPGVGYPFDIHGRPGVYSGKLGRSTVGDRVLDVNTDGLAHVGMLPDFIEDLRQAGVTDHDIEPLFKSAEAFVRMWERAELDHVAPTTTATRSSEPNAEGWYNTAGPFAVSFTASDNPGGVGVSHITYGANGATSLPDVNLSGTTATTQAFNAEGATTVTYSATDNWGNAEAPKTIQVNIDRTAPTAAVTVPAPGGAYGLNQPVSAVYNCDDATSGVKTCEGTAALYGTVDTSTTGEKQFSVTATDNAGNTYTKTITYTVTPPSTTTAVTSDKPDAKYGDSVTFSAAVTPTAPGGATPAGSVQFFDGTDALGTAQLAGGVATLTVPGLSVGAHSITAAYSPSADYTASTSPAFVQAVGRATPTFDFAGGPFTYDGQPHAFNVTVRGINNETLGAVDATYDGSNLPPSKPGSHVARAGFGGNADYEPATGEATLVINKAQATITLSGLHDTYDGTPKAAAAATTPAGLDGLSVTYDGSTQPPTAAGSYTVVATLANDEYEATEVSGTLVIGRAAPVINWAVPADIVYGTRLGAAQLNAAADIPGTFTYAPAAGTLLNAGQGQTLSVSFVPSDTANYSSASAQTQINVLKATPVFSDLTSTVITLGTATSTLSGKLDVGGLVPPGSVSVTLNGVTQAAAIQPGGAFSTTFATSALPPSSPAYAVSYAYAGDANFNGSAGAGTLSVAYQVGALFDASKSYKSGAVVPVKIQLLDVNLTNVSSPSVGVTALGVIRVASSSSVGLSAPGNSSPDLNFRYDPTVGTTGGYTFNLGTKGYPTGTYILSYAVGGDSTVHTLQFQMRQ